MSEYEYKVDNRLPERSPEDQQHEWELLADNIDLIIRHDDVIQSKKEFFFTELSFGHISTTITGTTVLPLGVLLLLWKKKEFLSTCPECGGRAYIVNAAGSPLSGTHKFNGFCAVCKKDVSGSKHMFLELCRPSWELAEQYPNHGIMKKTVKHYFSPGGGSKDGIIETVIREKIQGVMLEELINQLRSLH